MRPTRCADPKPFHIDPKYPGVVHWFRHWFEKPMDGEGQSPSPAEEEAKADDERKDLRASAHLESRPDLAVDPALIAVVPCGPHMQIRHTRIAKQLPRPRRNRFGGDHSARAIDNAVIPPIPPDDVVG